MRVTWISLWSSNQWNARRIVDFRNQLTHEYPMVDDALVWAIVEKDVRVLRRECSSLLENAGGE